MLILTEVLKFKTCCCSRELQHHDILLQRNLNELKHTISDLIPQEYLAEKNIDKIQVIS